MAGLKIAVIPARAGSKRVPHKNRRIVAGQPLLLWSINAARESRVLDRVIVSSDDDELLKIAQDAGVTPLRRPAALATDTASTADVLRHTVETVESETGQNVELVVLLQPTSPLRERGWVDRGLADLEADPLASSLQAVYPLRVFTGSIVEGRWVGDFPETTRSQELPVRWVPSGSLYIYRYARTLAVGEAWGDKVLPLSEDPETMVNIDDEADFRRLDFILAHEPVRFRHLLGATAL